MPWIDAATPWGELIVTPASAGLGLAVLLGWYVALYAHDARATRELSERYAAAVLGAALALTLAKTLGAPTTLWPAVAGVAPVVALGLRNPQTSLAQALDGLAPALGLAFVAAAPALSASTLVCVWILASNLALRERRPAGLRFSLTWLSALPLALWL